MPNMLILVKVGPVIESEEFLSWTIAVYGEVTKGCVAVNSSPLSRRFSLVCPTVAGESVVYLGS